MKRQKTTGSPQSHFITFTPPSVPVLADFTVHTPPAFTSTSAYEAIVVPRNDTASDWTKSVLPEKWSATTPVQLQSTFLPASPLFTSTSAYEAIVAQRNDTASDWTKSVLPEKWSATTPALNSYSPQHAPVGGVFSQIGTAKYVWKTPTGTGLFEAHKSQAGLRFYSLSQVTPTPGTMVIIGDPTSLLPAEFRQDCVAIAFPGRSTEEMQRATSTFSGLPLEQETRLVNRIKSEIGALLSDRDQRLPVRFVEFASDVREIRRLLTLLVERPEQHHHLSDLGKNLLASALWDLTKAGYWAFRAQISPFSP